MTLNEIRNKLDVVKRKLADPKTEVKERLQLQQEFSQLKKLEQKALGEISFNRSLKTS